MADKKGHFGKKVGQKRTHSSFDKGSKGKFSKGKDSQGKFSHDKKGGKPGKEEAFSAAKKRRESHKVSDLIKKLRINYNKLLIKKTEEEKPEHKPSLVKECMELIGDKYSDLVYKHDGCRILQAMIKHGSCSQKSKILHSIKEYMTHMISAKYSYHLAKKAFFYAPNEELKADLRKEICTKIGKYILQQQGSEVIEFVYSQTEKEKERRDMVLSFYDQYFLLLSQTSKNMTLAQFLKEKPQLKEQVLVKIESIVQKLVHKGMSRHSIVQQIMSDYVTAQDDIENLQNMA